MKFVEAFEDDDNVFIILELCERTVRQPAPALPAPGPVLLFHTTNRLLSNYSRHEED